MPQFDPHIWYRTCQECGHKQNTKPPNSDKELTSSYRNSKCKNCKSEGLDYGTYESQETYEDA